MKNNIAFLYSNDHTLSRKIAEDVADQMKIGTYIVEDRAEALLSEEGPLKDFIIKEFGKEAYYTNGQFNTSIFEGMDSANSPSLDRLQEKMNNVILDELKNKDNHTLVISNQLIETGILHLSKNLIVCKFDNIKEYDEYVNIESIKDISTYYIKPSEIDVMTYSLRGCLIDCWDFV